MKGAERGGFSVHARARSFVFAGAGLRHLFRTEHNMWLHGVAAAAAVAAATILRLGRDDWRWIVLAIGLVWTAEATNTAIEQLADAVTLEPDARIGAAKDLAAAGVLVSALVAAVIGGLTFVPAMERML